MKAFTFTHPNPLDKVKSFFQYAHIQRDPLLTESQKRAVNQIKTDGFTILENFITASRLKHIQQVLNLHFTTGEFSYPVLAQSKISPERDRDILDNYLLGTPEFFMKRGITFNKSDFKLRTGLKRLSAFNFGNEYSS